MEKIIFQKEKDLTITGAPDNAFPMVLPLKDV